MIYYSTDKNIRIPVVVSLAFLAILTAGVFRDSLSGLIIMFFELFKIEVKPTEFINSLSATAIVFAYIRCFGGPLWRVISRFTPSFIPNFTGTWHGYIQERKSFALIEHNDTGQLYRQRTERMIPVYMEITQDFFRINILFRSVTESDLTTGRDSDCTMAQIDFADGRNPKLRHTFGRADMVGEVRLAMTTVDGQSKLAGQYSSSKQRIGFMELVKARRGATHLCLEARQINGPSGPFIAAAVDARTIEKFMARLRRCVGGKRYDRMNVARIAETGNDYGLTIVDPEELQLLAEPQQAWLRENLIDKSIWVELVEIRKRAEDGRRGYFIAADSANIDQARQHVGLATEDLQVPLGLERLRHSRSGRDAAQPIKFLHERMSRSSESR